MKPDLQAIRERVNRAHEQYRAYGTTVDYKNICQWDIPLLLAYIAELEAAQQWVPVTKGLPEKNQVVDVIYDHRRETDVLFTDLGWKQYFWNPQMGRFIDGVTHWMPIPQLPGINAQEVKK